MNPLRASGPAIAGLVLGGGEGRRFGGPKAWATLPDGRTFLEACAAALAIAGARPIVATLPPGSDDPGIAGLDALPLPRSGLDMFASLRLGLERLLQAQAQGREHVEALRLGLERLLLDEDWCRVAVLPVDHPLVRQATVAVLAAAEARAVIPSFGGKHGHPVVIDREVALGIVSGELPGPTLREVLAAVGARTLSVDDPGVTANCNTPDALAEAWTACLATR